MERGIKFNFSVNVDDSNQLKCQSACKRKAGLTKYFRSNQDFKRALGTSFIPQTLIVKTEKYYINTGYQPGDEDYLFEKLNIYADSN